MQLKWPGIWSQHGRAAPGMLVSRYCSSKVAVWSPVAYTLCKHRQRGCVGLRSCPDMAQEALGPDKTVVHHKEAVMFLLLGTFPKPVWKHPMAAEAHVPLHQAHSSICLSH